MTEQHVAMLRRFADRIVLLFDADTAGDAAVDRAVGLFVTQPVEIAIAPMPPGVDPDEYLLKEGAEAFEKLIAAAPDALAYKWKQLARQFDEQGGEPDRPAEGGRAVPGAAVAAARVRAGGCAALGRRLWRG